MRNVFFYFLAVLEAFGITPYTNGVWFGQSPSGVHSSNENPPNILGVQEENACVGGQDHRVGVGRGT